MTHSNFKSALPSIKNGKDIFNCIGYALNYQYMFEKQIHPLERINGDEKSSFKLLTKEIDRLYLINANNNALTKSYHFIGRVQKSKKQILYIALEAHCSEKDGFINNDDTLQSCGRIFICENVYLFMSCILPYINEGWIIIDENEKNTIIENIYKFLKEEDDIEINVNKYLTNKCINREFIYDIPIFTLYI